MAGAGPFLHSVIAMNPECGCCGSICFCGRPLGPTLRLLWASGNGSHGTAPREFVLTYGMVVEPGILCTPFSPDAFPAYTGTVSGTFPMPMGGTHEDTLEVVVVCACINCEYCVYYRWANGTPPGEWHVTELVETDCECPALFTVGSFSDGDTFGYQISDIIILEYEENCA